MKEERKITAGSNSKAIFKKAISNPNTAFVFLFLLMICFLFYYVRAVPGDDLWAKEIVKQYNLLDYIRWRYETWSGRLPFEALGYLFIGQMGFLWPWINAGMSVLLARGLWRYATLGRSMSAKAQRSCAWLSCFSIGLFGVGATVNAMFWMSGSTAYLWPLAFGITAFLPFVYALRGVQPKRATFVACILCAVIAGWGQEQVSLCLFAFSLCTIGCLLLWHKKVQAYLWIQTALTAIAMTVSLTAPGNFSRLQSETATWFPDFFKQTVAQRAAMSLQWLADHFINQTGLLLIFVWGALAILLFIKGGKMRRAVSILCAGAAVLIAIGRVPSVLSQFLKFVDPLKSAIFSFNDLAKGGSLLPYLIWVPLLALIPVSVFSLYGFNRQVIFPLLLCGASVASALLITFSPTIYASGSRTIFIPSALLVVLLILLVKDHVRIWSLLPFAGAFALLFFQLSRLWVSGFYI